MMMNGEMTRTQAAIILNRLRIKNWRENENNETFLEVEEALYIACQALTAVSCEDCKHRDSKDNFCYIIHRIVDDCDFCSRSERVDSLADCGHCKHGKFIDSHETCGYCDHNKRWTDRVSSCPDWRERHGL